jgi:hypothetical protein
MSEVPQSSRRIKNYLENAFKKDNWQEYFDNVLQQADRGIIPSMFHLLYNKDELIKWRAVSAFGIYSKHIADSDPSKLNNIVRRCVWMLTEESGGIAWGVPEAMGEMLANSYELTKSHTSILMSYIYDNPDGSDNYLEHEPLRFGVIWGVSRLAEVYPEHIKNEQHIIEQLCELEHTARCIALVCRIIGQIGLVTKKDYLKKHSKNPAEIPLFLSKELNNYRVMDIANEQLSRFITHDHDTKNEEL